MIMDSIRFTHLLMMSPSLRGSVLNQTWGEDDEDEEERGNIYFVVVVVIAADCVCYRGS